MDMHSGLKKARKAYHSGVVGLTMLGTIGIAGATGVGGALLHDHLTNTKAYERYATAAMIATDATYRQVVEEKKKLDTYLEEYLTIRVKTASLIESDVQAIDDKISEYSKEGRHDRARELSKTKDELIMTTGSLNSIYNKQYEKLDEIRGMEQRMAEYSTLMRRAAKIRHSIDHEFVSYARGNVDRLKDVPGYDGLQNFIRTYLSFRGKTAKDADLGFQNLREILNSYAVAERGKQGIENLLKRLNLELSSRKNMGELYRETCVLLTELVQVTNDPMKGIEFLDYIEKGTVPDGLDSYAANLIRSHNDLFGLVDDFHEAIMHRMELVDRAESLGVELEKKDLEMMLKLKEQGEDITEKMMQSNEQLRRLKVSDTSDRYLQIVNLMKSGVVYGTFGFVGAELLFGYYIAQNSRRKRKILVLELENSSLKEDNDRLMRQLMEVNQDAEKSSDTGSA